MFSIHISYLTEHLDDKADGTRYANSRHAYSWPRITAMMGDGLTKYDHDHDNEANEIAGCSVR
jgi:hypothetical protein